MELIKVKIKPNHGAIIEAELKVESVGNKCLISLNTYEIINGYFEAQDLFGAFVQMHSYLDQQGAKLLCNGARRDAFPSGMSRRMGGGRKTYITRLGMPSRRTDLVDIFDYAEARNVGTIQEQKDYHDKWVSSLRD